ncbi:MAG TPA: UDP-3-O-(3-hydroxymyristoyl)glucosamine N-acyltransferase [Acidiferrobacterales bacterium]|nr:UDP-3-O-(3-hydroxymyristoyl)glucosamine N-acyltransferase [Acidiferrobacterales bacterium]
MAFAIAELAQRCNARVRGDGNIKITGVAALETAGPADIVYVTSAKYHQYLATTRAGAVILAPADEELYSGVALIADNPRLCFARIAALLYARARFSAGTHPTAVVDKRAALASDAWVGAHAVVGAGAVIGNNVFIGAGCYVGENVRIGEDSYLTARVTVNDQCIIGKRCIIYPGAVIGSDGFGYANDGAVWVKMPQLGRVIIGDDVEIGANTTVDRGALGDTVIGNGVKLDNLIQIAHNVQIGEHTAIAACVGIAGSAIIGKRCMIGGGAGILGHLQIADDVQITATSLVSSSIYKPGVYSSTMPVEPVSQWRKNLARFRRLDEIARRLKKLEQKIHQIFSGEKN